ncbi:MAG: hypothetical protein D3906_09195, partial [Candidatus Electrothrix sp. AUS1_2]|nr:hypothetical protein [Candidatus Electrothrix sp. AUS1_2]
VWGWVGKDLVEWMGWQLSKKYEGLKEELAKKLVKDYDIFPLFDGLDELLQTKQEDFVRAFNEFQKGRSLVICCRIKEYRCLQEKVALNHAVILQDISEKKLGDYLKRLQLYSLWDFLKRSQMKKEESSLFELARRPLFLNIMLTLENERSLSRDKVLRKGKKAENRLWELYLAYCLKEKIPSKKKGPEKYWNQYSKEHSIRWLYCLANRIKTEGKVEFRLDELHPDYLYHIWKFKIVYGLLSGIPLGLIIMSFLNSAFGLRIIPLWMAYVLLRDEQVVKRNEIIRLGCPSTLYDWKKTFSGLLEGIFFGSIIGGLVGLIAFGSLAYGLSCIVIFALIRASRNLNVSIPETVSPYQTLFYAGLNGCFFVPLTSGTAAFVYFKAIKHTKYTGYQLANNMQEPSVYAVFFLMFFISIISYGSITIIRHYLVRLFLWQENQLPLRLVSWLEFLHHRKILQRVGGSYHFIHKELLEYLARTHYAQSKPNS